MNRTKYIRAIDFLVKKASIDKYVKLVDQQEHTFFTRKKYLSQQRNYLKSKKILELNTRIEIDLEKEKEALKELTRAHKPFLSAGRTNFKNSKHILCMIKKKKKNLQDEIEDKYQSLELQLNLSQSI